MIFQKSRPKKDLVLGSWEGGLAFVKLAPFIISLKKTGFRGDICFLVNRVGIIDRLFLRLAGVKVIKFDRAKILREVSAEIATDLSASFGNSWTNAFRWLAYYSFLSDRRDKYSRVLLTDLRDVVFQKDPFDFDLKPLCLFRENKKIIIQVSQSNSAWIKELFGEEVLHEIGGNVPICSGVIIGLVPEIIELIKELLSIPLKEPARYGHDQGILNYYVYKLRPANAAVFPNEDGPVMHLGPVPSDEIRLSSEGLVLNESGNAVNIVYQYDRHSDLTASLLKKYSFSKLVYFIYFRILQWFQIYSEILSYRYLLLRRYVYPAHRFIIFAQERTGSELLRSLLNSHRDIYCDDELFNTKVHKKIIFPSLYIRARSKLARKAGKDFYGFKLLHYQLPCDQKIKHYPKFLHRLSKEGWKFIYLSRRNVVRRALSDLLAKADGVFHIRYASVGKKTHRIHIKRDEILEMIEYQEKQLEQERIIFSDIPHIHIIYEDDLLRADKHQETADKIFKYIGAESLPVVTDCIRIASDNLADNVINFDELCEYLKDAGYAKYLT